MASTISVDTIQGSTAAGNVKLPAGCILQVENTIKTDTFDTTSTGPIDLPGLSVTITPKYATSKILIMFNVHIIGDDSGTGIRLLRGSSVVALGDASGSRARMTVIGDYSNGTSPSSYSGGNSGMTILDSPNTTSSTTYKLQIHTVNSGNTYYINRSSYSSNDVYVGREPSHITLMEVAA